MSTATIAPDGAGGYVATALDGSQTSHRFYAEALARLRSLGLAQASSSQAAQRGQVEEWVTEASKSKTTRAPTDYHPRAAICTECQTPFIWASEPRTTCGQCPGSRRAFSGYVAVSGEIDFGRSF